MQCRIRKLSWFYILLILTACTTISPGFNNSVTTSQAVRSPALTITSTLTSTATPAPSPSFTSTIQPPPAIPSQIPTEGPTAILLPLDTQLNIFESLWQIVKDTYVYPDFNGLDWNAIHLEYHQKISAGMTNEQFYQSMGDLINQLGDDHSVFLNPQEEATAEEDFKGDQDYVGIGILVSAVPERNHAVILSVFPNSPAESAGMQPRDSIISVDGVPILDRGGYLQDIVRGPVGTTISLSIQTPGKEPRSVRVTRQRITGEIPVFYTVITTQEGTRVGYILLVTFDDSTVDEQVAAALQAMTAEASLGGLILDNRMNRGGSNTVLEPVLSYFTGGNLGAFINRFEERTLEIKRDDINGSSTVPLVVLIGSETASFGEIFAGILKDKGRAYLIGNTTEGNVEILGGYDFEDGSRLWLANETFRPYNHPEQDWEKTGITPDLVVRSDFDQYTLELDPAVMAAIKYLSER